MGNKVTAETPVSDEVKNHPRIKLCAGTCQRWTRSQSMTLDDFPGTIVRSADQKCQKCLNDERRAGPVAQREEDARLRHTITGLENFMARSRQRRNALGRMG